jgi:hypothetical protein
MRWQPVVFQLRPAHEAQPCTRWQASKNGGHVAEWVSSDRGRDDMAALASNASWQRPI